jgi:hypothetical protein
MTVTVLVRKLFLHTADTESYGYKQSFFFRYKNKTSSRDSSGSVVSVYGLDVWGSIPGRIKGFFF